MPNIYWFQIVIPTEVWNELKETLGLVPVVVGVYQNVNTLFSVNQHDTWFVNLTVAGTHEKSMEYLEYGLKIA